MGLMSSEKEVPAVLSVSVSDSSSLHESIGIKHRQRGVRKPLSEQVVGDVLQKSTGKWVTQKRCIDRSTNWYSEIVRDPETGTVIHGCEEPLNLHQGHGSAKRKKN